MKKYINFENNFNFFQVIQCKECVHWKERIVNNKGFAICPVSGMEIYGEDFCSYGERKGKKSVMKDFWFRLKMKIDSLVTKQYKNKCPFCGNKVKRRFEICNGFCSCGAKYYALEKIWLNRNTGEVIKGSYEKKY